MSTLYYSPEPQHRRLFLANRISANIRVSKPIEISIFPKFPLANSHLSMGQCYRHSEVILGAHDVHMLVLDARASQIPGGEPIQKVLSVHSLGPGSK